MRQCKATDCERDWIAKEYCSLHYYRWRKYGDPLAGGPYRAARGTGYLAKSGYRKISVNGKLVGEHRLVMEVKLGRALLPGESVQPVSYPLIAAART